jgi:GntR family transcriptional regulator, transcriptional repressor for pyruvate dehydrogenase complex
MTGAGGIGVRSSLVSDVISTPKMAQVVASQIRKRIVSGELVAGEFLPFEAELVTKYRTSKPIIREALRILETEGLIEVRRGGRAGAQVLEPSITYVARSVGVLLQHRATSVADVWDARSILECDAVGILAARHRASDVGSLRSIAARIHSLLGEPEVFSVEAIDFHEELVKLTRNKTMHVLTQALHEIVAAEMQLAQRRSTPEQVATGNLRATRAQTKLIQLIADGDKTHAVELWRRHMNAVGDILVRTVGPAYVIDIVE